LLQPVDCPKIRFATEEGELNKFITGVDGGIDVLATEDLPTHVGNQTCCAGLFCHAAYGEVGLVACAEDDLVETMRVGHGLGDEPSKQGIVLFDIDINPNILWHERKGLFEGGNPLSLGFSRARGESQALDFGESRL